MPLDNLHIFALCLGGCSGPKAKVCQMCNDTFPKQTNGRSPVDIEPQNTLRYYPQKDPVVLLYVRSF